MTSRPEIEALLSNKNVTDAELRQLEPSDAPILMDIFRHDQTEWNAWKRRTALRALGFLGTEQAVALLIAAAEDPAIESRWREAAVRSLGYANRPEAYSYLESTVDHPDFGFRKSALIALADSRSPRVRQVLRRVQATDPDERLRELAAELVSALRQTRSIRTASERPNRCYA
jgi:HEAT repeat protein